MCISWTMWLLPWVPYHPITETCNRVLPAWLFAPTAERPHEYCATPPFLGRVVEVEVQDDRRLPQWNGVFLRQVPSGSDILPANHLIWSLRSRVLNIGFSSSFTQKKRNRWWKHRGFLKHSIHLLRWFLWRLLKSLKKIKKWWENT